MSVETGPFLAMCARMIRAAGRRVGDGDEAELAGLLALEATLARSIAEAVTAQREGGKSWAAIAAGTGTTRQAAHARWGKQ